MLFPISMKKSTHGVGRLGRPRAKANSRARFEPFLREAGFDVRVEDSMDVYTDGDLHELAVFGRSDLDDGQHFERARSRTFGGYQIGRRFGRMARRHGRCVSQQHELSMDDRRSVGRAASRKHH